MILLPAEVAVGEQANVEPVEKAEDSDVEPAAVSQRGHRVVLKHSGAGAEERCGAPRSAPRPYTLICEGPVSGDSDRDRRGS